MQFNILHLTTLEVYPTEIRAIGFGVTLSLGMILSLMLPIFDDLNRPFIAIVIVISLISGVSALYLRDTKFEKGLKYLTCDVYK